MEEGKKEREKGRKERKEREGGRKGAEKKGEERKEERKIDSERGKQRRVNYLVMPEYHGKSEAHQDDNRDEKEAAHHGEIDFGLERKYGQTEHDHLSQTIVYVLKSNSLKTRW